MRNLFEQDSEVYYWPYCNNLVIISPATMFMFCTVSGSNNKKLCIIKEIFIFENNLEYIGIL